MTNDTQQNIIETMLTDRAVRVAITRESHFMFFHFYFAHYIQYETASFQKEMFALTEDETIKNLYIVAFRGSGKSTIITTSYPIWAILGKLQKKFVLILSQTQNQAKQHLSNLKRELENNVLLENDLGPFKEETDEWGSMSLVFAKSGARITVASSEQSIRGLRHGPHRPDLIIGDDVENMASAKTKEGRQKTYDWIKGEVIPAGDKNTKFVIVGNLLHEDSLLMHLKSDIENGDLDGVFRAYPLLDENGMVLWPGKYPSQEDIRIERKKLGNEKAWRREYLLEIIPDDDQIITRENIHYYEDLPKGISQKVIISVDLAISEKNSADYTAIVSIAVYGYGDNMRAYILPHPINKRMNHLTTLKEIENVYHSFKYLGHCIICVENVGYQSAAIEALKNKRLPTKGIHVTTDKRSRLVSISHMVMSGAIMFPKHGAERLLEQIIGFGKEKHDDLVDAFSMAGREMITLNKPRGRVFAKNPFNDLYRR